MIGVYFACFYRIYLKKDQYHKQKLKQLFANYTLLIELL